MSAPSTTFTAPDSPHRVPQRAASGESTAKPDDRAPGPDRAGRSGSISTHDSFQTAALSSRDSFTTARYADSAAGSVSLDEDPLSLIDAGIYPASGGVSVAGEYDTSTGTGPPISSRSMSTRSNDDDYTARSKGETSSAGSAAPNDTSRVAALNLRQVYPSSKDSAETVRHHRAGSGYADADTGSPADSEVDPNLVQGPDFSDGTGGSDTSTESARSMSARSPTPSSASSNSSISEYVDQRHPLSPSPVPWVMQSAVSGGSSRDTESKLDEPRRFAIGTQPFSTGKSPGLVERASGDAMSRVADWAATVPSSPSVPDTDSVAPVSPIATESSLPGAPPLNSSLNSPATDDTHLNNDSDDVRSEGPSTIDGTEVAAYGVTADIEGTDRPDRPEGTDVSDTSGAIGESYIHRVYHLQSHKQPSGTRLSDDLASINFGGIPHLAPFEIPVQREASDTTDPHDSAHFDVYPHGTDGADGDANGSTAIIEEPATYARYRLPGATDTGGYIPVVGTGTAAAGPEADDWIWDSNVASPTGTSLSGGTESGGIEWKWGASDESDGTGRSASDTAGPTGYDIDWGWGKSNATNPNVRAGVGSHDSRMDIDWDWATAAFVKRPGSFVETASIQRDSLRNTADSVSRTPSASRWSALRSRAKVMLTTGRSSRSSSGEYANAVSRDDSDAASILSSIKSAISSRPVVSPMTDGPRTGRPRTGRAGDDGWLSRIRGGISGAGSVHDTGPVLGAGKHKSRGIRALLDDWGQGHSTRIRIDPREVQAPEHSLMSAGGRWG